MEKTLEYRPAFPASNDTTTGLTKREYFAAMALQGILSNAATNNDVETSHIVEDACLFADALIEELNKEQ